MSETKYTADHEWIRTDGDVATIGITDFAQGELGDVVYVELPKVGASFGAHDVFGTVEAVKAVSDLYSPVGGEPISSSNSRFAASGSSPGAIPYRPSQIKESGTDDGQSPAVMRPGSHWHDQGRCRMRRGPEPCRSSPGGTDRYR